MSIESMMDEARERAANPEGIEVRVETTHQDVAEYIAGAVAGRIYPDRRFGRVLHSEQDADGAWLVVVQDYGVRRVGAGGF